MMKLYKGGFYSENNSQKHSKKCKKIRSKSNSISHDVSRWSYDGISNSFINSQCSNGTLE